MTIAMMIECMAGKSGAVHGLCHDATPFVFGETSDGRVDAIDFFAKQLEKAGYNYYGTESLYSGTDGVEMKADIFFGIIHYQRLRHMVSDKFQVRSVGTIDQVTRQPIKGEFTPSTHHWARAKRSWTRSTIRTRLLLNVCQLLWCPLVRPRFVCFPSF